MQNSVICSTLELKYTNLKTDKNKNATSPLFDSSGNKNIGATIRIGREIRCLPYARFLPNVWIYSQIFLTDPV